MTLVEWLEIVGKMSCPEFERLVKALKIVQERRAKELREFEDEKAQLPLL